MLNESPSALKRVVMSLKVAALVTVLGTVVLAAERQLATDVSPEEIIATDLAPAHVAPPAPAASTSAPGSAVSVQQTPEDYFPAQFPEPKGEPASQSPTF
jgi:hypothetical protein